MNQRTLPPNQAKQLAQGAKEIIPGDGRTKEIRQRRLAISLFVTEHRQNVYAGTATDELERRLLSGKTVGELLAPEEIERALRISVSGD